jgi:hypothetical protein
MLLKVAVMLHHPDHVIFATIAETMVVYVILNKNINCVLKVPIVQLTNVVLEEKQNLVPVVQIHVQNAKQTHNVFKMVVVHTAIVQI